MIVASGWTRPGLSPHVAKALRRDRRRIVVTGAGGWLGRATLELLREALGAEFTARVCCYGSAAREVTLRGGVTVAQRPLAELPALERQPSLLLHLAFLTKDRAETMTAADYRAANRAIGATVLGALDPIGVEAVFVASSGAARFADDPDASAAMRLYGALKADDEADFAAWARATETRVVIARMFNLAGPYINKPDKYALSAFITAALAGEAIRVYAPHRVVRGYVAIRELMSLVFALLLDPAPDVVAFDTGGAPRELVDVAAVVARVVGSVAVERAPLSSDRRDDYRGDTRRYDDLLARHGIDPVPFAAQIAETADYLRCGLPA